jgi:hypothetical protein
MRRRNQLVSGRDDEVGVNHLFARVDQADGLLDRKVILMPQV